MQYMKSTILMIAVTCDLALAFGCYPGRPEGGCYVQNKGTEGPVNTLIPANHPDPKSLVYSCNRGATYCCTKNTFKATVPDINRCKPRS
ncbi:hypothetical protein Pst134EA_019566 [Puccinia striiformis f. sp. tritici]|uniref:hypothetical protein n=1 Tax=Puccinia striiformis f. sp. tritici TaxID=168172 RepID=UPI00200818B5|nr:hypothetical protein Pst134EA_019566 [Puccinia striiformis f. sp. tritici]KAH9459413.1 hypothetical protein Pst134EA_019566 [Puccinia striiformis f. sp. tritici]KAI9610553.1 hypothetical protein H4Q26_006696 [Puccinia striiformis f. sp. tritici PST-130]